MLLLKGCPRCGGDLATGFDDDLCCIQCGFVAAMPGFGFVRRLTATTSLRNRPVLAVAKPPAA
jgi:hypothetical protein